MNKSAIPLAKETKAGYSTKPFEDFSFAGQADLLDRSALCVSDPD